MWSDPPVFLQELMFVGNTLLNCFSCECQLTEGLEDEKGRRGTRWSQAVSASSQKAKRTTEDEEG